MASCSLRLPMGRQTLEKLASGAGDFEADEALRGNPNCTTNANNNNRIERQDEARPPVTCKRLASSALRHSRAELATGGGGGGASRQISKTNNNNFKHREQLQVATARQSRCCVTQSNSQVASNQVRRQITKSNVQATSQLVGGPIVKRPLKLEEEQRSRFQLATINLHNARRPLRQVHERELNTRSNWKSSTSVLAGTPPSAKTPRASSALRLAKGEHCCELPHHKTAGHHQRQLQLNVVAAARYLSSQSSSASLGGKRAVSSLSLVGNHAHERTRRPTDRAAGAAAHHKVELLASSQVTNSRLRQGALFARRQLHLLPPPSVALGGGGGASRVNHPQQASAQPIQQAARTRQSGQVTTAAEARRRATRQVVVIPMRVGATSAAASGGNGGKQTLGVKDSILLIGNINQGEKISASETVEQQATIGVQKKASQLSSSSSTLSLDAFVVKRPRQQQHSSSSASSSCSSISGASSSRRWSISSGSPAPHSQSPPAGPLASSLSCAHLNARAAHTCAAAAAAQNQIIISLAESFASSCRGNKTPPPPPANDGNERFSSTDEQKQQKRTARTSLQTSAFERSSDDFSSKQNNGRHDESAELQPKPKLVPNLNSSARCLETQTSYTSSQLSNLLLPTAPSGDNPTTTINEATIQVIESSDKLEVDRQRPTEATGKEHAFLAPADQKERDIRTPSEVQNKQIVPFEEAQNQCQLDEEKEEEKFRRDVDIVAIGCSPVGFVVAPPPQQQQEQQLLLPYNDDFQPDKRNQLGHEGSSLPSGIESNTSCNINNNNNQVSHQLSVENSISANNVDMMISLAPNNNEGCTSRSNDNIEIQSCNNTDQQQVNAAICELENNNNNARPDPQIPLDLSNNKSLQFQQATNIMPQESTPQTKLPKNQPLGLHQSSNIAAAVAEMVAPASCRAKTSDVSECCAVDLTLGQTEPQLIIEALSDSSMPQQATQQAQLVAEGQQNNVIARQKLSATAADIPIRFEPICDFYDLETRPFARGKFAQVKRCTRKSSSASMTTGESYAAKCIKKRRRLVDIKHEILLEIEALKLSYETRHIVRLYEVYETPNEMILILEMANGGELQRVLDDEEQIAEPLVRKMIDQILEGLIYLHDNDIAHLDIKPQNLLLSQPFPNGDIKLCDFGISRRITRDCEIREICGTPDYVAPEILRYDPISLATDMWSLGVLTYVLLSGYSPFGSENKQQTFCNITQATLDFPPDIFGKVSDEAVDFIRKLVVREPTGRLTSRQAKSHHWISNHKI